MGCWGFLVLQMPGGSGTKDSPHPLPKKRLLNFEAFRALSTSILPNGGAKWWFTMVQSIKNHQLNKSKTLRLDFKQPPFEKTKSNRQPGQAFCNIKTWFRIALYGDTCPKWKRYEAGPNLNTNHPCFFLGTIFSQLANPNLIVLCTDGVFRLTFHDMILLSVGLILKDQKQGHCSSFQELALGLFPTESSTSFQALLKLWFLQWSIAQIWISVFEWFNFMVTGPMAFVCWRIWLGGGNSFIFDVHPDPWGNDSQFWRLHIFFKQIAWFGRSTTNDRWPWDPSFRNRSSPRFVVV